mgnify:CR=1 FL=1
MSDENIEKKFRSNDRLEIRNARVMWVGEPREINDEKTLCSAKVISQPGNEKDSDCWITFTGANKLGERIFGLKKGDRVCVAGKPFFTAYVDKEGVARPSVEIKFPEYVDITYRAPNEDGPAAEPEEEAEETPVPVSKVVPAKRGPGRPKKQLPFDEE